MVESVQGDLVKARVARFRICICELGRALTALTHPVTMGRALARRALTGRSH